MVPKMHGCLVLEDGTVIRGEGIGAGTTVALGQVIKRNDRPLRYPDGPISLRPDVSPVPFPIPLPNASSHSTFSVGKLWAIKVYRDGNLTVRSLGDIHGN